MEDSTSAVAASPKIRTFLTAIRWHQWSKNSFVFVGLIFGHRWQDPSALLSALLAFIAFCCAASSIYLFNDLIDQDQDRQHPKKRHRPIASGALPARTAVGFCSLLMMSAIAVGWLVSPWALLCVLSYLGLNTAYSIRLKHVVLLDVFCIASGFMLRIFIGTLGIGVPPSHWLVLCSLMVTLFLGFAKRRAELSAIGDKDVQTRAVLDKYSISLLDSCIAISTACVIISYSLYTVAPETIRIHGTDNLIYSAPIVVYALYRYIFLLHHYNRGEDPSREVFGDPHILVAVALWALCVLALLH